MCSVDYAEPYEVYEAWNPKARRQHVCDECGRTIERGEQYRRADGLYDGHWDHYKACHNCAAAAQWLMEVCNGYLQHSLAEELREHWDEGYGFWLGRAVVGMRRQWKRRDGSLMTPLSLPAVLPVPA